MQRLIVVMAALTALFIASPAQGADLVLRTTLGNQYPTETGSVATGAATLRVHTDAQTVDADITVAGIRFTDLAQHLAHSRMGPMHLHRYLPDGDVALILPFPLGASYVETATGFTVALRGYAYAEAAAAVGSDLSFEAFLAALASDPVYLTVHTNAFVDGEITGRVAPAS